MIFDIVIPVGPNDYEKIKHSILYTQKNIIGYRNIYLVSAIDPNIENTIFINESIFPFQVCQYLGKNNRNGWYFQQLIKLYASYYIPGILPDYLVVDSDTFFIQPTTFFNEDGLPFYNIGTEYHIEYFHHMNRLHPILSKNSSHSGITHHMLFQKRILDELFELVENYHGKPFYEVFLSMVDSSYITGSGASEYEIYFHYLILFHRSEMEVRHMQWKECPIFPQEIDNATLTIYNYISCHHWMTPK